MGKELEIKFVKNMRHSRFAVFLIVSLLLVSEFTIVFQFVPNVKAQDPNFGYETIGASSISLSSSAEERIRGSNFTITEDGTADSITVALSRATAGSDNAKCAIYKHSDSSLVGSTEQVLVSYTTTSAWYTFNFAEPKPTLTANTEYILVAWADYTASTISIAYSSGATDQGHLQAVTYDGWPDPLVPTHGDFKYSIYCTYTAKPIVYSNVGTNATFYGPETGSSLLMYAKWTSSQLNISGYIFGWNNSGTWQNDTWTSLGGDNAVEWTNVTKTVTSSEHVNVNWEIWVNDTDNNWDHLDLQTFHTVPPLSEQLKTAVYRLNSVTGIRWQRKTFYAASLWWLFFANGTYRHTFESGKVYYVYSSDSIHWSYPVFVRTSLYFFGESVNAFYQDGYVYVTIKSNPLLTLYFRRGTPNSNGTITWSTSDWQVALPAESASAWCDHDTGVDSEGYPWVLWVYGSSTSTMQVVVSTSKYNNGSWVTADGYPLQLDSNNYRGGLLVTLPNRQMYAVMCRGNQRLLGRLYNGTEWQITEYVSQSKIQTTYSDGEESWSYSAIAINDTIHLIFNKYADYNIQYVNYTSASGWSSEVTVEPSTAAYASPVMCLYTSTNDLYAFWAKDNCIYQNKRSYSTGSWEDSPTLVVNATSLGGLAHSTLTGWGLDGILSVSRTVESDGSFGLAYMVNKTSECNVCTPYQVKYFGKLFQLTLHVKDSSGNAIVGASVNVNLASKTSDSNGQAVFMVLSDVEVKVKYQNVWVNETTVTMDADKTFNVSCTVYRLTVYVTNDKGVEMSGATLTLTRSDGENLTSYGLTPKTAGYYNSTHARYVWTQLANQTASYTVFATSAGKTASQETSLTANKAITLTIPVIISSGPGVPTGPPAEQPPPYIPPVELPKVPGVEFQYGIMVLVGVVVVAAVVGVAGRGKRKPNLQRKWQKKTRQTRNLDRAWRKKRRR